MPGSTGIRFAIFALSVANSESATDVGTIQQSIILP
ncbi:hypothetical protein A359_07540 [secondary endosymbiont of Ctenarytaina eucalypti]|uniref:Uncharacterized protein n=1 Tax=secondary endosymbiont of Ctenarytaina eucalypti TaxID=1199245 RepID=J3Z4A7_9ENTR|nr:hypothetical protein A359_07540 [secondary endosymbiont of Ctenarytaina eucalypti]